MLDIKYIRESAPQIREGCRKKHIVCDVDHILELDEQKRKFLSEIEENQAEHNRISKQRGKKGQGEAEQNGLEKARALKAKIKGLKDEFGQIEQKLNALLLQVPNMPADDVPTGEGEQDNVVVKEAGKKPKFSFEAKDHLEIGEALDIIDVKRAAKIAGSRFGFIKGELAQMEFALVQFVFEKLIKQGFMPVVPPVLLKPEIMQKMGYIDTQDDKAERYFLEKDNLYLIGTAEQAIGPMHADEVFEEKDLPKRYVGFSTCFREEAGSHGKDTRGILRVHQFDKVEMFSFAHPNKSQEEHEFMIRLEENIINDLKLPYRLVQLCTGDIARVSAVTFDIETWMPGQKRYRETHSCSNCTDFQARRLNIRYRDKKTNKLEFVHMLNGTAIAIGRMLIAILENNQKKDGSIDVPKVLHKYLPFKKIAPK